MNIVDKYGPREFSAISHDGGIVLCANDCGAFLWIRFPEEIQRLQQLLNSLDVERLPGTPDGDA